MPTFTLVLSEQEREAWRTRATETGLTVSAWVRMICNGVAGGGRGSFQPPPQAGPVPGGAGPAAQSGQPASGVALHQRSPIPSESSASRPGRAQQMGQVARKEGPAGQNHSAPGEGQRSPKPHDGADGGGQKGNARSSGEVPSGTDTGFTPRPRAAATSGTGVSVSPVHQDDVAGETAVPATTPAPETRTATCNHPRDQWQSHPWGRTCGVCNALLR